ncbi:NAD(P)H nitroreductase [Neptuniibacter sp. QD29_5]|uniref:NAD(P)H nitroreductase n=1 Tax=Neptuniibacter sp. QD29_5 TaxID=3398207 RepID=UPI0039F5709D
MEALELLHNRVSCPVLNEPGPTEEQLKNIYQAALRAPDHGALRPWRFLSVQGEARAKLGELCLRGALANDAELPDAKQDKIRAMPLRAPCMLVVIAAVKDSPKIPVLEQEVSAGCAAQNMILAAYAQGLGAMWRTGDMAYNSVVREGLGLTEQETIIGYIYLGTPKKLRKAPVHDQQEYVIEWTGV